MDNAEPHRFECHPDRASSVPEDRGIRRRGGIGADHRFREFRGIPGDRIQGGRPCLRDRLQDLYDRGACDPLWDLCELGVGDGEIFLEVLESRRIMLLLKNY